MSYLSALHDADALIVYVDGEFRLLVGAEVLERGPSARKLSQFAFANGAQSVRHDYDLALDEPNRYGPGNGGRTK